MNRLRSRFAPEMEKNRTEPDLQTLPPPPKIAPTTSIPTEPHQTTCVVSPTTIKKPPPKATSTKEPMKKTSPIDKLLPIPADPISHAFLIFIYFPNLVKSLYSSVTSVHSRLNLDVLRVHKTSDAKTVLTQAKNVTGTASPTLASIFTTAPS